MDHLYDYADEELIGIDSDLSPEELRFATETLTNIMGLAFSLYHKLDNETVEAERVGSLFKTSRFLFQSFAMEYLRETNPTAGD